MKAIIVFYDTLNRRYLPCYNPAATTIAPNFQRLAEHSVQFDNSYVGSMPCMPARRELHTGRSPGKMSMERACAYREFSV